METLWQDAKYGARMLLKNRSVTLIAVLTLGLGIGANTAIFSVVNALALRPLPVEKQDELVVIYSSDAGGADYGTSCYPDFLDWRDQNTVFTGLAAFGEIPLALSVGGDTERAVGQIVTGNYFDLLGVAMQRGRAFLPEEDRTPGTHPVAVVSDALWRERYGADPGLPGRTILVNGYPYTVIGIAPPGFRGTELGIAPQVFVPMMMAVQARPRDFDLLKHRGARWMTVIGRLKPGVTLTQADAAMDPIAKHLSAVHPDFNGGYQGVRIFPIRQTYLWPSERDSVLSFVAILFGVVGLVLVIACANVANLLLSRAAARRKEIAVRLALGASRGRLVRQLLVESMLLALLAGGAGLLVALWSGDALLALRPPGFARMDVDLALDLRVFGFAFALSLLTGVLFGLAPAWAASRAELGPVLKDESGTHGYRKSLLRSGLVVAQVSLSLVLLIGAGLFVASLVHARAIDLGLEPRNLLLGSVDLRLNHYTPERGTQLYRELLERVRAIPGVDGASLAEIVPLGMGFARMTVNAEGRTPAPDEATEIDVNQVAPGYFRVMRTPVLRGREFTDDDRQGAPRVVIVNDVLAERFWPGQDALGKRLIDPDPAGAGGFLTVVGVVKHGKHRSLGEPARPLFHLPLWQSFSGTVTLHVRTIGEPRAVVGPVRRIVQSLDPHLPVFNVRTMGEHLGTAYFVARTTAAMLSLFGGLALLLASVGLYGVMSYAVSQRAREVGIRMALGARRRDILHLMIREGMTLTVIGVVLGLAGALATTRLLAHLLHGIGPLDAPTFAGVSVLLALVALAACWIPARRAAGVDPMVALRYE
jgi:predicted permease